MMAKRTALFGMLICLTGAYALGQAIAPTNQGDIGLFTMPTADNPRAGQFTFGTYGWLEQRVAGPFFDGDPDNIRVFRQISGEATLGLGLTRWWSVFGGFGVDARKNRGDWQRGVINGIGLVGPFEVTEGRKIRVGTKVNFVSEADKNFRLGMWLAGHIPVGGDSTIPNNELGIEADQLNSGRADWEWGGVATKGILTGMVSYTLMGEQDNDVRLPNDLRFGIGVDLPVLDILHIIFELDRHVLDGGDRPEPDYSMLAMGARFWLGHTGWAFHGAVNANMDMLINHGNNPAPWGGIVGFSYAAWPPAPPPPVVVPQPEPVVEQRTETIVTTPAPAPPPPPSPRSTSDEIYFDGASSRLTNIAKAVLDGVALRMKNDLNATAVVTGYTDNTGIETANMELGAKRAQAAKDYLVTRHGIDPSRVTTSSKGASDPAYDNATAEGKAKNRRAQIVVTLISGS